ncbi:hypothetical protein NC652_029911 [Populus alba x Populus x berolinensis]|nr:hypothetical protein NC652_029911 [Populus alba x Populus x berolinensis]
MRRNSIPRHQMSHRLCYHLVPKLKAVCVCTQTIQRVHVCFCHRLEGQNGIMAAGAILNEIKQLLATKLGSQTPIIVLLVQGGIMGRDVVTGEHREVYVGRILADGESNSCFGIIFDLWGFYLGLKVDAHPAVTTTERYIDWQLLFDDFVMNIRHYAASVSGWASPWGWDNTVWSADQKPVMEKLREFSQLRDTVIVGDERAQFLYRSGVESRNDYGSSEYFPAAVALTFSLSNHMTCSLIPLLLSLIEQAQGKSNSMLHLSSGVSAIGPRYKAVSVRNIGSETGRTTLLTARREGEQEISRWSKDSG